MALAGARLGQLEVVTIERSPDLAVGVAIVHVESLWSTDLLAWHFFVFVVFETSHTIRTYRVKLSTRVGRQIRPMSY